VDLESLRFKYLRRVVGPALRLMGIGVGDRMARRLGRGVFELQTPARRYAEARLRDLLGPAADIRDVERIIRDMYEHTGRFWIESLHASRKLRDPLWRRHIAIQDENALTDLALSPRGCILATGAFGHVGVLACALGRIFRPVHVIVDTLIHPALTAWQRDMYNHPLVRPIDRGQAGRAVPRLLESGRAVLMLCDTERRRGRAVETPFLGRTLRCYPTLGRLSHWYDVPVAIVTCTRRETPFTFDLRLSGAIDFRACASEEGVVHEAMAELERAIVRSPEQYLWWLPTLSERGGTATKTPATECHDLDMVGRIKSARVVLAASHASGLRPALGVGELDRRCAPDHIEK